MTSAPRTPAAGRAISPLGRRSRRATTAGRAVSLATVVALAVVLTGCTGAQPVDPPLAGEATGTPAPAPTVSPPPVPIASAPPLTAAPAVLGEGVEPASVRIPAIELDEPLIDLGIKPDGSMYVPAEWNDVGWFEGGGKPGGRGPTVIAGHVDSVSAPAVFHRLDELVVGDVVEVTDVNGTVVDYVVDEIAAFPKAQFPTARVFGALPTDELRLITCGGFFDPAAASYVDNTVVFATRA